MTIKKVLIQLNQLGYGGTEKAILSFAEHIDRSQFELFLFYWDDRFSAKYYRLRFFSLFSSKAAKRFQTLYQERFSREERFQQVFGSQHFFSGTKKEFLDCINKIQPDILHFNRGIEEDFYTDLTEQISPKIKLVESNIFGKSSNPTYLSRLKHIYFVSRWLKDRSPWAGDKGHTLYNPILLPKTKQNLRQELGISASAIVIGRAHRPDLGHDDFLEKVYSSLLVKTDQEIVFLSLGSKPEYSPEFMKKYSHLIKSIAPTTDEKRISQFYNSLDVFSHRRVEGETFGMIIAEAMIHGIPVLSHRSSVDNAQIEVLGDENLITEFSDTENYAEKLLNLIKNQAARKHLSSFLQERAMRLFSASKATQELENFYRQL